MAITRNNLKGLKRKFVNKFYGWAPPWKTGCPSRKRILASRMTAVLSGALTRYFRWPRYRLTLAINCTSAGNRSPQASDADDKQQSAVFCYFLLAVLPSAVPSFNSPPSFRTHLSPFSNYASTPACLHYFAHLFLGVLNDAFIAA
jgi:hypothetical protein